ncbi:hypothetical protein VSS74_21735 [Conexibacter stalactiti]|uniref:Uncharacterized protein n=1 Tax=Conexibacter stalactiti TaxID=1940611 RepID=A0ABU4HVW8_9ACTN|nr:hypothetical protein [Conexibacter stalactiti]MDW5596984.1 hypothetical protein [Conexibacter stalactiti]MEC5037626.1 hypothetical protein [Conexibacter stalactiti]
MSLLRFARLAAIGIIASVALASAVSTASATRLSFERATLTSSTGTVTVSVSGITFRCNVTLGTRQTTSIAKVAGTPIETLLLSGAGSSVRSCNPPTVTAEILPGAVFTYLGFTGPLPNILQIRAQAINAGLLVTINGTVRCLYRGTIFATYNRNTMTLEIDSISFAFSGLLDTPLNGSVCPGLSAHGGVLIPNPKPRVRLI